MTTLEKLHDEAYANGVYIEKRNLPGALKGFYYEDITTPPIITISHSVQSQKEEICIIAEELGHYYTSIGNLVFDMNVSKALVRKQEETAKRWAVFRLISLNDIVQSFKSGARSKHEVAEHLGVTEKFLDKTVYVYYKKYGICKTVDNWTVYFNPFGFMQMDF